MERTIGKRIKECRQKKGLTQETLAEILFTKKNTVSDYENDKIDIKVSVLKEIAEALGTSVSYLSGETDEEPDDEVMQMAMILMQIKNKNLRKAAMEQVKVLAELDVEQE